MSAERKARVGENTLFRWEAPVAISGAPVFTVRLPSGDVPIVLTSVHATQTITGVSTDRRTLTATGITVAGSRGAQGDWGAAFFVTDEDGAYPVRIIRVEADAIRIAEPLPTAVAGNGSIQWATWHCGLSAVTGSAIRSVPWGVTYVTAEGADLPTGPSRDEGLLHIVRQPFATGLTSQILINTIPAIGATVNRSQQDFSGVIDHAEAQLIAHMRAILQERGLFEDDAHGPTLRHAHAYLSAAVLFDDDEPEKADRYREQGKMDAEEALRSIWVDANKDGVVDDGEEGVQLTGGRSADVGGSFAASISTYPARFSLHGTRDR